MQFRAFVASSKEANRALFRAGCGVLTFAAMDTALQPTLSEIEMSMAKTNELFSAEVFGRRNFDALDQIYTAKARILPPGAPMIMGREAIKRFWSDTVLSANARSAVLSTQEVIQTGDCVLEIGRALLTVEPPGQQTSQMEAKYVVFWRQELGRWKWHVDIWNSNS